MTLPRALAIAAIATSVSGAAPAPHTPSPFYGEWRIEYPCGNTAGTYEERCATGRRDVLEIDLIVHGDRLCGTGMASAQLGNHVGDVAITGTVHGRTAEVDWDIMGAHGAGTMTVHGRTLVFRSGPWKSDGGPWSFPPADTTTLTRNGAPDPSLAVCPAPADDRS